MSRESEREGERKKASRAGSHILHLRFFRLGPSTRRQSDMFSIILSLCILFATAPQARQEAFVRMSVD